MPAGLVQVLLRQSQQTLVYGLVLSPLHVEAAGILGDEGDMLRCLAGAGASRLPKTLGVAAVEAPPAVRDVEVSVRATGSSHLPVALLYVPSTLGSGAASFRECLRNRFCSDRLAYRWCRGSLSLIRRVLEAVTGLRVIVTLPVDFRIGRSVGKTGGLVEVVGLAGPKEAVDGALLRADELGSERSAVLRSADDREAEVLRADAGFRVDETLLVTLLAAFTGATAVPLLRAPDGVGSAAGLGPAGFKRSPFVLVPC